MVQNRHYRTFVLSCTYLGFYFVLEYCDKLLGHCLTPQDPHIKHSHVKSRRQCISSIAAYINFQLQPSEELLRNDTLGAEHLPTLDLSNATSLDHPTFYRMAGLRRCATRLFHYLHGWLLRYDLYDVQQPDVY